MRRTYRSKKDAGCGLDPRDMLQTVDEKSSAFDAFYIQNIKQTKREMSCIGSSNQYGVASNKVRKRKYVKRILKEVEPAPRESLSQSVFLTPDKSIRVNKAYDPFDMLLNSSLDLNGSNKSVSFEKKQPKRDGKTYTIRQLSKAKKFNCSSADSSSNLDSNKENSDEEFYTTSNTSDLRTHKLLVERGPRNSHKLLDDSIKNIVNNISLLNNINQPKSTSVNIRTPFRFKRNRLTTSIQSPIIQKSPLCSTPFKSKYRGASIFKLSPIFIKDQEDSPNYVTVTDDHFHNNDSVIFVTNNIDKRSEPTTSEDHSQPSAVTHLPDSNKSETNESLIDKKETQSNESLVYMDKPSENLKIGDVTSNNNPLSSSVITAIQTTEVEPFFGFCDNKHEDSKDSLIVQSCDNTDQSINLDFNDTKAEREIEKVAVCFLTENYIENVLPDENEKSDTLLSDSIDEEKESLYDTCSSEESSLNEELKTISIKPTVEIERMNDSPFFKYYEKNTNVDSEHEVSDSCHSYNRCDDNDDSSSYKSETESLSNNSLKIVNQKAIDSSETNEEIISSNEDELDSNNEEDRLISFVTTRKRNEVTNMSTFSILDESNSSSIYNSDNIIVDHTKINSLKNSDLLCLRYNEYNYINKQDDMRMSVAMRGSSRAFTESISQNSREINADSTLEDTLYYDELNVTSLINDTQDMTKSITIRKSSRKLRVTARSNGPEINADSNVEDILSSGDELNTSSFTNDSNEQDMRKSITITKSSRTLKESDRSNSSEINADCYLEDTLGGDELNVNSFIIDTNEQDMRKSITITKRSRTLRHTARSNSPGINNDCYLEDTLGGDSNEQDMRKSITITRGSRTLGHTARSNSPNDCNLEDTLRGDKLNLNSFTNEQNTRNTILIGKSSKEPAETSNKPVTKGNIQNNKYSVSTRNSTELLQQCIPVSPESSKKTDIDWKPIVLPPGKKWERSLSIYRRMSMLTDHFDQSILEDEPMKTKGRKYRQSVISTMEMQELSGSQHNESINSRRSTFVSKTNRSTLRILKDPNSSRLSLCNTTVFDDSKGFLNDECDDTIIELSKLSIADAGSEVTILDIHDTSNRIATARDYVLRRCNQTDAIFFDECYPDSVLKNCHKIGEGVYGEVFLWRDRDGRARVMKVVPVAGDIKVNGEHQKQFHEIISEIEIAMELSALRAPIAEINHHLNEGKDIVELDLTAIENATDVFNEVLAVKCVSGSYPSRLLDLWDLFDECKGSENDNPAILPLDQQYIVLELANAGQDLESYQFNNAEQAHALFLQVAFALAVGEEAFQFEHRDLHWGNVLIAPTDEKCATFVLRGRPYLVARCGVAATVIDYSLSRLSSRAASTPLYNDLSTDDGLFDAVGDYQFEVYRLMRDKLGNDWKNFEPYTNILWLHYTVDKMITALRYKRVNTKIHKHYIEKLKGIKNRLLQYGSTVQFVLTDNEF